VFPQINCLGEAGFHETLRDNEMLKGIIIGQEA
jgi:hypothetical protein